LFAHVLQGDPVELDEFEKEISKPILMITDHELQTDIEDIVVDALMRRSYNPIRIHLRLKYGFNPDAVLTQNELYVLSNRMFDSKNNKDSKHNKEQQARDLASFYVRISNLRNRIMHEQAEQGQHQTQIQNRCPKIALTGELQHAYATQMENMRNKQRENQEHFDRIMRTLLLNPDQEYRCIHPNITSTDLDALELQVQDILECGCATHELRCIKIEEAAMEHQICDALIAELNALDEMI
jgi:transcription termination factor NusB